ncbi:MAG TPA: hypothetical protein VIX73_09800 [Kofleriaceae bacterium]|jgi:hypothetical protein
MGVSMRISVLGVIVLFLSGCAIDTLEQPESYVQSAVTSQTIPTTSGSFVGHYVVPTSADLAAAANFGVPEVDWTVSAGTATLHYELPVGLVGGTVPITFTGAIASGATSVSLSSTSGNGTCTASGSLISCSEAFSNLGTLPISMTVVQQTAVTDGVSVADRTAVANLFPSDPIGTVSLDLTKPAADDGGHSGSGGGGGDGGGGGGGGRGPH